MSLQRRHQNTLGSLSPPLEGGIGMGQSNPLELQGDSVDLQSTNTNRVRNQLFAMQGSLVIPNGMTLKDKLSFCLEQTLEQNLFERLDRGSVLEGPNCSLFWSEYTKVMSDALCALTQIDSLGLGSHLLNGSVTKLDANSWFSMKLKSLQSRNSFKISCPSSTSLVLGFTDSGNINPKSRRSYKTRPRNATQKQTPNSIQKIRVYPSKELHRVWKKWLAGYRWIYNWTINQLGLDNSQKAFSLQTIARSVDKPDWVNELPGHQLQEAVSDAVDSYWQAIKNNGQAKYKSARAFSQVIKFKVGNFKQGKWYPRLTKGLDLDSKQPWPSECQYGTQLVYQKGKWYGCFPEVKLEEPTTTSKVIALDPGNRTFLTGFDGETILEIGKNDIGRINRLCSHLDQLMSKIVKSSVKRQRYKMRKASARMREKIQNLVKDLHNKAAHFLTENYKLIFLPTFETSQMVMKSSRKIRSKTARNMLTLSHYKFAQHLSQMAERKGNLVVRCNESYTSKTCPECGHIHNRLGGNKIFHCPNCGYVALRDENGARNIMLRALLATAFTVNGNEILILGLDSDI